MTPGSPDAIAAGCTCPVLDNARGRGAWGTFDLPPEQRSYWITAGCPLHASPAAASGTDGGTTP